MICWLNPITRGVNPMGGISLLSICITVTLVVFYTRKKIITHIQVFLKITQADNGLAIKVLEKGMAALLFMIKVKQGGSKPHHSAL